MGFGRATAALIARERADEKARSTSANINDEFLSRLAAAEARDAPTGAGDPRHFNPEKAAQVVQAPRQLILPTQAYNHHAVYRQQHVPAKAVVAARAVAPAYEAAGPGVQRTLHSRNLRRHFQPLASQIDMSQPGAPDLKQRVSHPVELPAGSKDVHAGKGGTPNDRPAGGRANLGGPVNAHGTAHHHATLRS